MMKYCADEYPDRTHAARESVCMTDDAATELSVVKRLVRKYAAASREELEEHEFEFLCSLGDPPEEEEELAELEWPQEDPDSRGHAKDSD